jgi:hypothetical protein
MRLTALFFLTMSFGTPAFAQSDNADPHVRDKTIVYDGGTFVTNLFDLEYVGQLNAIRKKPFLIFTGCPCDSCDLSNTLYIHSPSDGPLKPMKKEKRYNLPGPINDYQTREELYVARTFWGEVIPGRFGVIWFQKELKDDKWVASVFFAELLNDRLIDGLIKSELKTTLKQVEEKKAWEIIGEPINSEPTK